MGDAQISDDKQRIQSTFMWGECNCKLHLWFKGWGFKFKNNLEGLWVIKA